MKGVKVDAGGGIVANVVPFTILKPYMSPKVYSAFKKLPRYKGWEQLPYANPQETVGFRHISGIGLNKFEAVGQLGDKIQALLGIMLPEKLAPALLVFEVPGGGEYVASLYMLLNFDDADAYDALTKEDLEQT